MFPRSNALTNTLRRHVLAHSSLLIPSSVVLITNNIPPISLSSARSFSANPSNKKKKIKIKTKSGNVRGSRGHGWWHHYRTGGGGRHLQGDYADGRRPPVEELQTWNQHILNMGYVTAYLDVTVGANATTTTGSTTSTTSEVEPTEASPTKEASPTEESSSSTSSLAAAAAPETTDDTPSEIEQHRLFMDLATTAMPTTTRNFLELCQQSTLGYANTVFTRLDKRVGLIGGDVVTNTGKVGRCATVLLEEASNNANTTTTTTDNVTTTTTTTLSNTYLINDDRHIMTHVGGTISMLCPKVKMVDSRFIVITQPDAPHLDGYHMAFGHLHPASLELVRSWVKTIFTKQGHPLTELKIVACGVVDDANDDEDKGESKAAA